MPKNPFDSPKEIEARAKALYGQKSAGVLDGLRSSSSGKASKPNGGHGFIMTQEQDEVARKGGTPSGFSRDKDGNLRARVQR